MPNILALDVGQRRTGVAFASDATGVPIALPTLRHASYNALETALLELLHTRAVTDLVVGLPLLPSGAEGKQAQEVRAAIAHMSIPSAVQVFFLDERYTTPRQMEGDPDAAAACALLETHLLRKNI